MSNITSIALHKIAERLTTEQMSFAEYLPKAWPIIEPATMLLHNWHIDCIAEHLEAVTLGQLQYLVINIPPRNLKSIEVSILWPTWSWTGRPFLKFIALSYSQSLANTFSKSRRDVIESGWYRSRWGNIVRLADDQNQKQEFVNTARGHMIATSVGGTLTGKGADIILIDDGIDPQRAESKADREAATRFVMNTVSTRLNDKKKGAIVEISQRTHKQDISGTLLKTGLFHHLNLPAIAPKKTVVEFPVSKRQIIREAGDVLHPTREDAGILAKQKVVMGSRAFEAQYGQNPTSDEGGIFQKSYWRRYLRLPQILHREWSWDTALEDDEDNDWTVGILFAHCPQGSFIEKLVRRRMKYPELRRVVEEEQILNPGNVIVIENKVSGISLAQDLKKSTTLPIVAYPRKGEEGKRDVRGDKVFRANLASPYVESGRVFLPTEGDWVDPFIDELAEFPNGEYKDQVDAFSQGINHYYLGVGRPVASLSGGMIEPARADWM